MCFSPKGRKNVGAFMFSLKRNESLGQEVFISVKSDLESFSGKVPLGTACVSPLSKLMKGYRKLCDLSGSLKAQWDCGVLLLAGSNRLTHLQCPLTLIHFAPVGRPGSFWAVPSWILCCKSNCWFLVLFLNTECNYLWFCSCLENIKAAAVWRCRSCPYIFSDFYNI